MAEYLTRLMNIQVVSSASVLDPVFHPGTRAENLQCRFTKVYSLSYLSHRILDVFPLILK